MFWSPNRSTGRIQRTASIVLFPVNTLEGDNPRHCEGRRSPSHVPLAPAIWFACDLPRPRGGLDPFWTAGDPLERVFDRRPLRRRQVAHVIALNRSPNQALSPETARASRTRFLPLHRLYDSRAGLASCRATSNV